MAGDGNVTDTDATGVVSVYVGDVSYDEHAVTLKPRLATANMTVRIGMRPPVECESAARLAWRAIAHCSLVALRRRLSPGLPLSHTSMEACDPAVPSCKALTVFGEALCPYTWATIVQMNCHATGRCSTMTRTCSPFRHPAGWRVFFARTVPSGPDTDVRRQKNIFALDCLALVGRDKKRERSE